MKTLLKIIFSIGLFLNMNAQSLESTSFKISVKNKSISTLKLDQKLVVMKGLYIDLSPQFGNQFISQIEAKKAKINLKDYYNDSDFGYNLGFDYTHKKLYFDLEFKYLMGYSIQDSYRWDSTTSVVHPNTIRPNNESSNFSLNSWYFHNKHFNIQS